MTTTTMLPIEVRLRAMFSHQLVCVIRASSAERAVNAAQALLRAGFKLLEVTMTVPGAFEAIKELAGHVPDDVMIGAGTVMNASDARQCIENGAQFIVSPSCEIDIIRPCRDAGMVAIPAGLTPTEILYAWRMGAHVVKIFPAGSVGGPAYVRALRGPLPDIPLWVSGMVTAREVHDYLNAGVQLIGLGAELLPGKLVDAGDWDGITEHARQKLYEARGLSVV
jgi:2-dehydro-3-deoxyphosphogluconate aldolase/(4S)-4-hydroxy-2-oxoglutarate aldolase